MEWKITHNNLVETSNGDSFAVGLNWMLAQHIKSGFKKELALSKQISANKVECGCTIANSKANITQLAMADPELKGHPSLAAVLCGMGFKNAIFTMQLSESLFWVLCINDDHTVEMTSDSVIQRFGVRDYIGERVALKVTGDKPKIYNLGEFFSLDDPYIDDRLELLDITELLAKHKTSSNSVIRSLSGNLIKHLMIGVYGTIITVAGGSYYYMTTDSDELIALKNGEYSSQFTATLTSVNQKFKKLNSTTSRKRLSREDFIALGREQYNSVVLTRTISNNEAIFHFKSIDQFLKPNVKGWKLSTLSYNNQGFYVSYERAYKAPQSVNYKELDSAMEEHFMLSDTYSLSPTHIEKEGSIRHYEISIPAREQKQLLNFLAQKKKVANEKEVIANEIVKLLSKLKKVSADITDTEGSVSYLGLWDKKDTALIEGIIARIENSSMSASPYFSQAKAKLKKLSNIEEVKIPHHNETLLGEGGVEDEIFPILQNIKSIKWGSYQYAQGFPRNMDDNVYKDERIIRQKVINLEFDRSTQHLNDLEPIYSEDYVLVNDIEAKYDGMSESVMLNIVMGEVNQDYINLKK